MQVVCCIILYTSTTYNFGFVMVLFELNNQFDMLLNELKETFNYRIEKKFREHFIDCFCHHQMIIK